MPLDRILALGPEAMTISSSGYIQWTGPGYGGDWSVTIKASAISDCLGVPSHSETRVSLCTARTTAETTARLGRRQGGDEGQGHQHEAGNRARPTEGQPRWPAPMTGGMTEVAGPQDDADGTDQAEPLTEVDGTARWQV